MFTQTIRPTKTAHRIGLLLLLAMLLAGCTSGSLLSGSSWPGLTIDDETAYIAYSNALYAVDQNTGYENWRFPLEVERALSFFAAPALSDDGMLVIGSYANILYGLRDLGGQVDSVWTFDDAGDRYIGSPVIVDDLVLAPNADGHLYALNLETGRTEWIYAASSGNALWSAPLVVENHAFLTSLDHELYCIDISNGAECWKQDLGAAIAGTPASYDDYLLVGTFDGELFAVSIENGSILWTFETEGWIWGTPTVAGDVAFITDLSGILYAIDLTNEGEEIWRQTLDGPVTAAPIVDDARVYAISEIGSVYAFEQATGVPAWPRTTAIEGTLNANAVLKEGTLYIPATGSECLLFAVDSDAGSIRCEFQPE